ncbi:hypothetical protein BC829DRAFT_296530 [Chytridium lagenaria]|nr:hypothetical protein BC829DRAFT_296530 [Chytridium lagenaria]
MESAHDSSVFALDWHPVGHILVSGSNDHTTRFWTRNRPGDAMHDRFNQSRKDEESVIVKDTGRMGQPPTPFLASPPICRPFPPENRLGRSSTPPSFPSLLPTTRCHARWPPHPPPSHHPRVSSPSTVFRRYATTWYAASRDATGDATARYAAVSEDRRVRQVDRRALR